MPLGHISFSCNAQMNLTLDIMSLVYASLCSSLFYQLPSCNLFTRMYAIIIIYGETPLVNCGPRSFLLKLINNPTAILLLSFSANKHHLPHIRLILCYSKPVRLTTSLLSWGKVSWLCECRFHVSAGIPGVAPCHIPPPTTFRRVLHLLLVR